MRTLGQGLMDKLQRVDGFDRQAGAVDDILELHDTAGAAAGNDGGAAVPEASQFPVPDGSAEVRMCGGKGAAQAAAGGGLLHLHKLDLGQGPQQVARFTGDPLRP